MSPPRSTGMFESDSGEHDTGRADSLAGSGHYPPADELLAVRSRFGPNQTSWPTYFDAELSVSPRLARPNRKPLAVVGLMAAAAVGGVVVWSLQSSPDGADQTATSTTTSAATAAPPEARAELRRLLPTGYSANACEFVSPPKDVLAQSDCDENSDPGGPTSATYVLVEDQAGLDAAFSAAVAGSTRVNCPGNVQSPGPWRRNATPQQASGTLYCGIEVSGPIVVWSDDARLLVSVVRADSQRPTFDELYAWWSSHS